MMIGLLLVYGTDRLISTLWTKKIREKDVKYLFSNYFGAVSDKKYLQWYIFYPKQHQISIVSDNLYSFAHEQSIELEHYQAVFKQKYGRFYNSGCGEGISG